MKKKIRPWGQGGAGIYLTKEERESIGADIGDWLDLCDVVVIGQEEMNKK